MTPTLHHECTRLPVTAIASCGVLLVAAEGPFLRFYHAKDSRFIASKRVFKSQAVHGISVYSEEYDDVTIIVVWGGRLIRAIEVNVASTVRAEVQLDVRLSEVVKAPDWILDLAPRFSSLEEAAYQTGACVAVTAHNALVQVNIERQHVDVDTNSSFTLSVEELTSSSRSILYSAHVFWESADCVLVAAGTAFGEIMYWSWNRDSGGGTTTRIHRIFLGHEGSVFGVHISKELPSGCCQTLKRIIASCSDDRTIRIWDVSDVVTQTDSELTPEQDGESERTHHTGFGNADLDLESSSRSQCIAVGWGHTSRVWKVQFLESAPCDGELFLLSAGEDATSRTWKLSLNTGDDEGLPYKLIQQDCAAHHNGKNIWSNTTYGGSIQQQRVVCGAADAKITSHPLTRTSEQMQGCRIYDYTMLDLLSRTQSFNSYSSADVVQHTSKRSKKAESLRSYCFLDCGTFLLTTNSGKVLLGLLKSQSNSEHSNVLAEVEFIDQLEDLSGYSICTGDIGSGQAFIAGTAGTIYMFSQNSKKLTKLGSLHGKIGDMFARQALLPDGQKVTLLLAALVGQKEAMLLYVDAPADCEPSVVRTITVPVSEPSTGPTITSMTLASTLENTLLFLGFRKGSVAIYSISSAPKELNTATLSKVIERVHDAETVTAMEWEPSVANPSSGYLTSVGRNGCIAVQHIDLLTSVVKMVHSLTLPIGPNVEGLSLQRGHVLVYGFSGKKWVLYDTTIEEEVMSIDTGGAHRSWAFQPQPKLEGGGTLIWTRATSMHMCSQRGMNHSIIQSGGHGREIKDVAVSQGPHHLTATGAEDTDIKLFEYSEGELLCRTTLRRHTTGIQHLQWSENGEYLFSSGGCEEFYIWRIRQLPFAISIGIVCEFTYTPESEHADLRIMSFDVAQQENAFLVSMVFSDSSVKIYRYSPDAAVRWQPLARGLYFTSCLTQCVFLSPEIILTTGTDGHTVVWPLGPGPTPRSIDSTGLVSLLNWQEPVRIHQSSSKVMASHCLNEDTKLIVSGGDDGSLAVLLTRRGQPSSPSDSIFATAPVLLSRTHGSAVTACALVKRSGQIFIVTSGNDQWLRLWKICIHGDDDDLDLEAARLEGGMVEVERVTKVKTNVADVSSMAVLENEDAGSKVLICGVGMEVVRLQWDT